MKIAPFLAALPSVLGATIKKNTVLKKNVIKSARRLDQYQNNQQDEDEWEFLQHYEATYLTCNNDMRIDDEYGVVIVRLCPAGEACVNGKQCSEGHGDYVLSLREFMENFMEQFEFEQEQANYNNNQNDDNDWKDFAECNEYNDDNNNNNNNNNQNIAYYTGPLCTEEGTIKISLFQSYEGDENPCRPENVPEDVSFYDLAGIELPWSGENGLMDDDNCKAYYCSYMNENNELDYNEFCTKTYEDAYWKCEEGMEYYSPWGKAVQKCESVQGLMPASTGGAKKGWIIALCVLVVVAGIGALAFAFNNQKKKAGVSQEGLMM